MTSTPAPPTASASRQPWRAGRSSTRGTRRWGASMRVELQVNGKRVEVDIEPRCTLARLPAREPGPRGHPCRLRAWRVRRLHDPGRRRAGTILPDAGGAGRWPQAHHHRGPEPRPRRAERAAGCLLRDARAAMRLLHARHDPRRPTRCWRARWSRRGPTSSRPSPATCAAARATARSSRPSRWLQSACAAPTSRPARPEHGRGASFKYVSRKRRVREDRRFVSGQATYVSDVTPPGTRHAAVLTSPYACARIVKIDASEALAMPGVHAVVEGRELAAATDPLLIGVDAPLVKRYPLAVGRARYAGEWVAVVVAETRALAEDAREKIRVEYEELPFVLDAEAAYQPGSVARASRARLQRAARPALRLGRGGRRPSPPPRTSSPIASSGGAAPPCRSRPSAWWRAGTRGARCWTCGPRSRCPSSPTRSRAPCACR